MKRYVLFVPLALFVLAACQKTVIDNPNYDPETNEVLTEFVFNVSTNNETQTKQNAAATQATASSTFRGIDNAYLLTYKLASSGILSADATADKIEDMGEIVSASTITSSDSRRILEMSLPLQTNNMLFYGKAILGGEVYDGFSAEDCYGKMDEFTVGTTVGSENFKLGRRLGGNATELANFYTEERLLSGIVSLIMNTNLKGANHVAISKTDFPSGLDGSVYKFDVSTSEYPELDWASYVNAGNSPIPNDYGSATPTEVSAKSLENKLSNAYKQMTSINTAGGELRAASGEALLRTITDLWTTVNEVRCATPTDKREAVAKFLANSIHIRMSKYFSATVPTDGAPVTSVAFKSLSGDGGIIVNFLSPTEVANRPNIDGQDYNFWPSPNTNCWPTEAQLTALGSVSLSTFPYRYNLPRGATHMAFKTGAKVFYYPTSFNTSGMGGAAEGGSFNAESYYYPAELMYFGNSPIRTSDKEHRKADYPTGAEAWESDASTSWGTDWNGNQVQASTRSVAMKYSINYGTALLETKVGYNTLSLKDNNRAVQAEMQGVILDPTAPGYNASAAAAFTEVDKDIAISSTSYFLLTGIIIGGQPSAVGWDFLPLPKTPLTSPLTYESGFVYDRAIPTDCRAIPADITKSSVPTYTLVLDNFVATSKSDAGYYTPAAAQDKVYIALEFQNKTGQDFYGNHNLIRDDGYFYLIGELNPAADGLAAITWPTKYVVPPYTSAGASQQIPRVFIQDYKTSATFKFGMNSLKHAYLTVPDLRSGSMSLGLSVDINWSTGLVFENVLLGGE